MERNVLVDCHEYSIEGTFHVKSETSKRLVIFIHGFLSHKDIYLLRTLAHELHCNSFRFNFPITDVDGQLRYGSLEHELNDLERVIHYSQRHGYQVIGLIGHSRGANIVYRYIHEARRHPTIKWVVALAGRYNMRPGPEKHIGKENVDDLLSGKVQEYTWNVQARGKNQHFKLTKEMILEFHSMKPFSSNSMMMNDMWETLQSGIVENTDKPSILIMHGKIDERIPWQDAQAFFDKLNSNFKKKLVLIPGADHSLKSCIPEILEFIRDIDNES